MAEEKSLEKLTVKELKEIALGMEEIQGVVSAMKKDELIAAIKQAKGVPPKEVEEALPEEAKEAPPKEAKEAPPKEVEEAPPEEAKEVPVGVMVLLGSKQR
ncbi:MAG: hypothetical protein JRC86_12490 [Deltaproteobacteria bacterium]|nr:hypothetical protein [Deltaproteobacteria bacterium]